MSRKTTTVYESHKEKWLTVIKTKDKNEKEWWISERHDEETPTKELLEDMNTKLSEAVDKSNKGD